MYFQECLWCNFEFDSLFQKLYSSSEKYISKLGVWSYFSEENLMSIYNEIIVWFEHFVIILLSATIDCSMTVKLHYPAKNKKHPLHKHTSVLSQRVRGQNGHLLLDAVRETTVSGDRQSTIPLRTCAAFSSSFLSFIELTRKGHAGREIENLSVLEKKVSLDR